MARFSAQDVYSLISPHSLTIEQAAAIEDASVSGPSLVVAGAGSGKTELMMVRVLYLVANSLAKPEQILGLTFTRKAASELAARVQQGLIRLRESAMWPADLEQDFLPAKIATYNSFGNEIFRAKSLELGYEVEAQLISDATALELAREIVENAEDIPPELNLQLDTLAERIVSLSSELTDNLVEPGKLLGYLEGIHQQLAELPKTSDGTQGRFAYTEKHLAALELGQLIARLTVSYREEKFRRNYLDFADQIALSLKAGDVSLPDYRFVLLDEYQDTSPIQTRLLARMFAGKPVMAVGDPNQSIYAWRGASSANLAEFFSDFGPGQTFKLSTSWRSGRTILDAANAIASQIPNREVTAVKLTAGLDFAGSVEGSVFADQEQEAIAVCEWLQQRSGPSVSAAILFRTKESISLYANELTRRGMTFEITGLAALLEQPEIVDLISILRVLVDPEATVELMRLISGPKLQLGPADIAALHQLGRQLSRMRSEVERDRPFTLVETLDELTNAKIGQRLKVSPEALVRLQQLAQQLRSLRSQLALSVSEVAWLAVREFELDIELFAHSDAENPLLNLQAFLSRVADYESASDRPSVAGFVSWLESARGKENFELPKSGAKRGVVQLMSVHAAKGLEWDVVAIPNFNQGAFPTAGRDSLAWLSGGKLPAKLRLDAAQLPALSSGYESQREFNDALEAYKSEVALAHEVEERRLAYVAITRAAKQLLLTASFYKRSAKGARETSVFFQELIDQQLVQLTSAAEEPETKPEFASQAISWPSDQLPAREKWERAAAAVKAAEPANFESTSELELLLKERDRPSFEALPELPRRLSVSAIVALVSAPAEFSARLLRPLPNAYSENAAVGTRFHASIEQALIAGSELEFSDWSEPEQKLGVNFQNSRFASLKPFMVEQTIEFSIAETAVVCKLDAVFEIDGQYQIVDWKSGKKPTDSETAKTRALQLAMYRIAFTRLMKIAPERVQASFFYAADSVEETPALPSEKEVAELLASFRTVRPTQH